jgi:hypothetical protein
MHETNAWFDGVRDRLDACGFVLRRTHPLPRHYWLTAYAEPLDSKLRAFTKLHDPKTLDEGASAALATHRAAVASIRADPGATDCSFYIAEKTAQAAFNISRSRLM